MKKVAIIAASLLVFWSCDSTPGGNKDVLPETFEASDHHGDGHGDSHATDSHGEEHTDDTHATDTHGEEGHDEVFVSDFSKFVKIEFTAFKTPEKVGVKGQFSDVKVTAHSLGESVANQMKLAEAVIKTSSIKTGDDARDTTLRNEFFSKLTGETITAKVLDIHEDKAEIEITMNGKTVKKTFYFQY